MSAQDPEAWADHDTARKWTSRLPGYGTAFNIRNRDEYPSEDLVLFDYDNARDPETGRIHRPLANTSSAPSRTPTFRFRVPAFTSSSRCTFE